MSAPLALEHSAALDQLARALVRCLESAAERQAQAATTDTADHRRPLGAGARPTQHEDRASALQERDAAFEEDDRDDCTTATADA